MEEMVVRILNWHFEHLNKTKKHYLIGRPNSFLVLGHSFLLGFIFLNRLTYF